MWARVATVRVDPARVEDARRVLNDEVAPRVREMGAKAAYWLADTSSGRALAVVVYASEQEMRDQAAEADAMRQATTERLGATVESVEEFEVIANV